MSSIPVRSLRLLPKSKSELDRISGNRGEIFYDSTSKSLRVFDGNMLGGTLLNASVSVTDTPPENPTQGSLWFNSATGGIYLYYQDGSSNQWIAPIVPAGLLGSGGSGSGTVLDGVAGKLAYYPSSGTTLNDLTDVSWGSNILSITGSINVSGQKNYVRFHWDTLADLNSEVSPVTWHGMLAHVHETGRVYVAHAAAWVPLANLSDVSGAGLTAFGTITVAGQSNVVAEQSNDTLTLVAGSNVTITTNATNDTITISASGGGGGGGLAFGTITVAGQSDIVADTENDILTISAGTGISVSTVPGTDTLTITNTGITNSFITIVTPTATLIAENSTSTLTLAAGTGISITGNALTDTVTISSGFNQSLNSTDNVIFNTVTASTLQSTGVGTPTYTSGSDFIFNTGGGAGALVLNGDLEVSGSATLGNLGIANGIASLGADGKLAASQIPTSLTGAVVFKGTWDANTNTPTLADGSGTTGWQYAVSVGGTRNLGSGSVVFVAGDSVIYNGTIWQRIPASTVAEAGTLTGATLASNILSSSLTSVGTLLNLSVTNTITGSVSGNAGTVTNGVYTSGTYSDPSWLTLSKSKVGLSNVDNTTDAGKPVSTATQTALDLKAPKADPTFTGTVTLGAVGNVSITGGTTGYVLSTNGSGTLSWVAQSGGSGSSITTYPATTSLDVTANGVISYLFNNMYSGNNPTVYAISGTTIAFNLNVSGHPFLIRTSGGVNYDVGLVHVAVDGTVSTGSSAQGKVSGTLYWQITPGTTGNYRYQCSLHAGMVGVIAIQSLTSPIFTGLLTSQQSTEIYAAKTSATGTVVHDFSTGAIWSHASISANFTANFTNVPTTVNRTIVVTLILLQGAAAYIPNAVQIDGVAQTLNWQGGSAPTGGINKKEIVSFTLIRSEAGPAWTVLGSLTSYG
jgi:plastocyanin